MAQHYLAPKWTFLTRWPAKEKQAVWACGPFQATSFHAKANQQKEAKYHRIFKNMLYNKALQDF